MFLIHSKFLVGTERLLCDGYKFVSPILKIERTNEIPDGWNILIFLAVEDDQTPGTWPPITTTHLIERRLNIYCMQWDREKFIYIVCLFSVSNY